MRSRWERGEVLPRENGWPVPDRYGCTLVARDSRSVHGNWYRFKYGVAESGAGANYIAAPGTGSDDCVQCT